MSKSKEKKALQLGMNPSTASGRLLKDILFSFIESHCNNCFQCGESMTRDNFSIEHKFPWLDSEDPVGLFFNLDNISFSHLSCNVSAKRPKPVLCGTTTGYEYGCRCKDCVKVKAVSRKKYYTKEDRRDRYLRTGH